MTPARCAKCGATIDPLALACPYCRFTTPAGIAAHAAHQQRAQVQAQWAAHASYVQGAAVNARMKSTATQALIFGILALVLFCTPLSVIALVQGLRARSMAKALSGPAPGTATAGLVLGIVSIVTSIGGIVLINKSAEEDEAAAEKRIAAIEKRIAAKKSAETLDQDVACGLAEIHARREGWDSHPGYSLEAFECPGKVTGTAEGAMLDDFRMKWSSTRYEVNACFKRGGGGAWYLTGLTEGSCDDAPSQAPATGGGDHRQESD